MCERDLLKRMRCPTAYSQNLSVSFFKERLARRRKHIRPNFKRNAIFPGTAKNSRLPLVEGRRATKQGNNSQEEKAPTIIWPSPSDEPQDGNVFASVTLKRQRQRPNKALQARSRGRFLSQSAITQNAAHEVRAQAARTTRTECEPQGQNANH